MLEQRRMGPLLNWGVWSQDNNSEKSGLERADRTREMDDFMTNEGNTRLEPQTSASVSFDNSSFLLRNSLLPSLA